MNSSSCLYGIVSWLALTACLSGFQAANAEEFHVSVRNFVFVPDVLSIQAGDTVTWTNEGGTHNVSAPGFFRCANGCDGQGGNGDPASNPWSFSITFDSPAVIDYVCEPHAALGMRGTINVGGSSISLAISGACPGMSTVNVTGGTPGGRLGLGFSPMAGRDPIPAGSCAGVVTDLNNPRPLTVIDLDANGEGQLSAAVPEAGCGFLLQGLDLASCGLSNVVSVPGASVRAKDNKDAWSDL